MASRRAVYEFAPPRAVSRRLGYETPGGAGKIRRMNSNRRIPFVLLMLVLAATGLCLGQRQQDDTTSQARALAQKSWASVYLKCGDSYFSFPWGHYLGPDGVLWRGSSASGNLIRFDEYKKLSAAAVKLKQVPISPAERLNGIEWEGSFEFPPFSLSRYRETEGGPRLNGKWTAWSEWENGDGLSHPWDNSEDVRNNHRIHLRKKSGEWLLFVHQDLSLLKPTSAQGYVPAIEWLKVRHMPSCEALPIN